ncbi:MULTISPECIES: NAD-dependent succinate-semialdehyde dehydrogenase [Henriciella]|uniref:NAD-dependent succinate-semialdehyde dehydrogenase n=1 Tax=Henriciella TaxID=453849 RepID=UPI0035158E43
MNIKLEKPAPTGAGTPSLWQRISRKIAEHTAGTTFAVVNPADGSEIAKVADLGASHARIAVDAAAPAQAAWAALSAKDRSSILRRWFDLIVAHELELGEILTREQGKPLAEARREVTFGANYVEWFAEEAKRAYGDVIPTALPTQRQIVVKQPVGIVGAITPWNFPSGMITRKAAPALAAGCAVILKPSEETPLSALALSCLADEAGIPAGVFQVITSSTAEDVAGVLTSDPRVRKISFTGSTRVGKLLMRQAADTVKRLSLELGGNAPFIVFDDADLDKAVACAVAAKFRNAGQTCVSANRFLVHTSIKEAFLEKFVAAVDGLRVSEGLDPSCDIGPMINATAKQKTIALVEDALARGAKRCTAEHTDRAGCFLDPVILSDVTVDMSIANTEIFGPVAPVIEFNTDEEAVQLANDTPYGLAAYFWTRDMSRAWSVSERLEAGMIGLNGNAISSAETPFGGIKESGLGREGSQYGLDDYLDIKYIAMGGI